MKKLITICMILGVLLTTGSEASTTGFYAATNELGYQGTIWNITDGTGPWATTTPRDAALYVVQDAPIYYTNYNQLLSNWYEHSLSNQNPSFLQLDDPDSLYATSITGGWDIALTTFTVTVSGQNNPYPYSRFWQPDNGVAWGVTFTDYTYTFAATFSTPAVPDNGGYKNSVAPDAIVGSFTGQFIVTYDVNKNPIANGDLYGFEINFSKAMFVPLDELNADGNPTSIYNDFGTVPEPATICLLGLGALGLLKKRRA
ncbi:MAG: PEP-CTERM sorting domain-containing protein [Phycisphaerae bacterium]